MPTRFRVGTDLDPRKIEGSASCLGHPTAACCRSRVYTRVGTDPVVNFAAMALVGALLFGPDTVISGCASQDLGGRYAAATAAGLVNGIGSLGPILQGRFTAHVSERYGWNTLFDCFVALSLLGALALVPGMITGVRDRAVRRD